MLGVLYGFWLIGQGLGELARVLFGNMMYALNEDTTTILDEDGNLAEWYTSRDFTVGS
jgi:hypothetical protein